MESNNDLDRIFRWFTLCRARKTICINRDIDPALYENLTKGFKIIRTDVNGIVAFGDGYPFEGLDMRVKDLLAFIDTYSQYRTLASNFRYYAQAGDDNNIMRIVEMNQTEFLMEDDRFVNVIDL